MADRVEMTEGTIGVFYTSRESLSSVVSALQSGDCQRLSMIQGDVQNVLNSVADTLLMLSDYACIESDKQAQTNIVYGNGGMTGALCLLAGVAAVCSGALQAKSNAEYELSRRSPQTKSKEAR